MSFLKNVGNSVTNLGTAGAGLSRSFTGMFDVLGLGDSASESQRKPENNLLPERLIYMVYQLNSGQLFSYVFPLNPHQLEITNNNRTSVFATYGNMVHQNFGSGIRTLSLLGHTGFMISTGDLNLTRTDQSTYNKDNKSLQKITEKSKKTLKKKKGRGLLGGLLSGLFDEENEKDEVMPFFKGVENYMNLHSFLELVKGNNKELYESKTKSEILKNYGNMYLYIPDMNIRYKVALVQDKLMRSHQNPNLFMYGLQFNILEEKKNENFAFRIFDDVENLLEQTSGLFDQISEFISDIDEAIDAVGGFIDSCKNFIGAAVNCFYGVRNILGRGLVEATGFDRGGTGTGTGTDTPYNVPEPRFTWSNNNSGSSGVTDPETQIRAVRSSCGEIQSYISKMSIAIDPTNNRSMYTNQLTGLATFSGEANSNAPISPSNTSINNSTITLMQSAMSTTNNYLLYNEIGSSDANVNDNIKNQIDGLKVARSTIDESTSDGVNKSFELDASFELRFLMHKFIKSAILLTKKLEEQVEEYKIMKNLNDATNAIIVQQQDLVVNEIRTDISRLKIIFSDIVEGIYEYGNGLRTEIRLNNSLSALGITGFSIYETSDIERENNLVKEIFGNSVIIGKSLKTLRGKTFVVRVEKKTATTSNVEDRFKSLRKVRVNYEDSLDKILLNNANQEFQEIPSYELMVASLNNIEYPYVVGSQEDYDTYQGGYAYTIMNKNVFMNYVYNVDMFSEYYYSAGAKLPVIPTNYTPYVESKNYMVKIGYDEDNNITIENNTIKIKQQEVLFEMFDGQSYGFSALILKNIYTNNLYALISLYDSDYINIESFVFDYVGEDYVHSTDDIQIGSVLFFERIEPNNTVSFEPKQIIDKIEKIGYTKYILDSKFDSVFSYFYEPISFGQQESTGLQIRDDHNINYLGYIKGNAKRSRLRINKAYRHIIISLKPGSDYNISFEKDSSSNNAIFEILSPYNMNAEIIKKYNMSTYLNNLKNINIFDSFELNKRIIRKIYSEFIDPMTYYSFVFDKEYNGQVSGYNLENALSEFHKQHVEFLTGNENNKNSFMLTNYRNTIGNIELLSRYTNNADINDGDTVIAGTYTYHNGSVYKSINTGIVGNYYNGNNSIWTNSTGELGEIITDGQGEAYVQWENIGTRQSFIVGDDKFQFGFSMQAEDSKRVLKPNDYIYLPMFSDAFLPPKALIYKEDVYKTDLDSNFDLTETIRDPVKVSGIVVEKGVLDFKLISGTPNVKQAISNRINCLSRTLKHHPEYGLPDYLGKTISSNNALLIRYGIDEQLRMENRIKQISNIAVYSEYDAIYADANVVLVNDEELFLR